MIDAMQVPVSLTEPHTGLTRQVRCCICSTLVWIAQRHLDREDNLHILVLCSAHDPVVVTSHVAKGTHEYPETEWSRYRREAMIEGRKDWAQI